MKLKRYSLDAGSTVTACYHDEPGEFVRYEDLVPLLSRYDKLVASLRERIKRSGDALSDTPVWIHPREIEDLLRDIEGGPTG